MRTSADSGPTVSVVFLAYNRRDELATSLTKMREATGLAPELLEIVVVDNASQDGTAAMVRERFPGVRLVENPVNVGASGWNAGFRVATGDYVLILDDDCYLEGDGLRRALDAAEEHAADLVSFTVLSGFDRSHCFNRTYETGLLSYWGCAALVSRRAIDRLGGYDPKIFIWANELEFTMRLLDAGFRHLFLPDVIAIHMKAPGNPDAGFLLHPHQMNNRHYGYIAAKLLHRAILPRVLARLIAQLAFDATNDRAALRAMPSLLGGVVAGLRVRSPTRLAVSQAYAANFRAFAGPWAFLRGPFQRLRRTDRDDAGTGMHIAYFAGRPEFYPRGVTGTLVL